MRITSTIYTAAMAAGMTLATGSAFAQECVCRFSSNAAIIGKVESVSGTNVFITQPAGYSPVQGDAALQEGATIIVGKDSATSLLLGDQECRVDLKANQSMTLIEESRGAFCAMVKSQPAVVAGDTGAILAVGAGTSVLVTGIILFSQDDNSISVSQQ